MIITRVKEATKEFIKVLRYGKDDIQTADQYLPWGVDSKPIKNALALYSNTGNRGESVIIGYLINSEMTVEGESALYSTDDDGAVMFYLLLKKDGTAEFGGNSDNLVRYSVLKNEYDKTKGVLDAILNILNGPPITEPGNGAPSALQTALKSALTGLQTGDIADSKIEEIKTL